MLNHVFWTALAHFLMYATFGGGGMCLLVTNGEADRTVWQRRVAVAVGVFALCVAFSLFLADLIRYDA